MKRIFLMLFLFSATILSAESQVSIEGNRIKIIPSAPSCSVSSISPIRGEFVNPTFRVDAVYDQQEKAFEGLALEGRGENTESLTLGGFYIPAMWGANVGMGVSETMILKLGINVLLKGDKGKTTLGCGVVWRPLSRIEVEGYVAGDKTVALTVRLLTAKFGAGATCLNYKLPPPKSKRTIYPTNGEGDTTNPPPPPPPPVPY